MATSATAAAELAGGLDALFEEIARLRGLSPCALIAVGTLAVVSGTRQGLHDALDAAAALGHEEIAALFDEALR
jgi:hypothetical protein